MACSPVSVISLIMDRALHLVIAKVTVRFPLKPGFFQVLFQPLRLFIQLQDHVHFEVHCLHESFLYQIDLILSLIDNDSLLNCLVTTCKLYSKPVY